MDINACVLDLQRAVYEAGTKEGQRWRVNAADLEAVLLRHIGPVAAKPAKKAKAADAAKEESGAADPD